MTPRTSDEIEIAKYTAIIPCLHTKNGLLIANELTRLVCTNGIISKVDDGCGLWLRSGPKIELSHGGCAYLAKEDKAEVVANIHYEHLSLADNWLLIHTLRQLLACWC